MAHYNQKGARTERELLHLLHAAGWHVVRAAGSGSIGLPCPDLIAGKAGRVIAIECKSGKATRYVTKQEIIELLAFGRKFGARPFVGIRFDKMPWRFLHPRQLRDSGKYYAVSKDIAQRGITLDQLMRMT